MRLDLQNSISGLLMFTRGYGKHPCERLVCSQGFAVGRIRAYPCNLRIFVKSMTASASQLCCFRNQERWLQTNIDEFFIVVRENEIDVETLRNFI